uniref:ATP synthase subunit a n=1 Tax=Monomachus antipodalis TaxID=161211 RepID=A0A0E3G7M9_9HYME|nr:ATP synthase F0 subunit 6 [Monomachus antipodalis]
MMNNLFSIFDPSSSLNYSMNWFSSLYMLMFIPMLFWFYPSRYLIFWVKILNILTYEFKVLMFSKSNYLCIFMMLSLFIHIMLSNFLGMFPYFFTSSSHMIMSLALSLSLWVSFNLYGWIKYTNNMMIHLTPQGTPGVLMSFMVLIELVSNIIRPWTLAIRLSANMIAGHLLLTLMSSMGNSLGLILVILLILLQMLLMILEVSVSFIQAYVFTVLSTLYSSEVN